MDITLVKNSENDIHDKHRREDEERQRAEELLQDKSFTLQFAFDRRRQDFRGRLSE